MEQGIERKYLIPPLGEDEETKKRRQQEAADAAKRELNDMMAKKKKAGQTNEDDKQRKFFQADEIHMFFHVSLVFPSSFRSLRILGFSGSIFSGFSGLLEVVRKTKLLGLCICEAQGLFHK